MKLVSDTLFTWDDLQAKLNNELLSNLGNFINRVLSFIAKPPGQGYGSIIPDARTAESHPLTKALREKVGKHVEQYIEAMEKVKLKQGLKTAMSLSSEGNAYLQESQFWKLYKEDQPSCSIVMRTAVGLVHLLACLLEPFIPSFSVEKTERVEELRQQYAGSQADRRARAEADAVKTAEQLKKTKISDGKKQKPTKSAADFKAKATTVSEISITRLDIRVRRIIKARKHPDADSLYVEEIDVGESEPRTVVSGLVKYIPLEEMQDRLVCVLCNLKPASMRGIKSHAMVLAASNCNHTKVKLVEPPKSAIVGERVTFPGFTGEPDDVLNPKKKVWETLQVDLHSDANLVACYKDMIH
ncbi:hypothetical protein DITRI_Ditri17bG0035900 [Diplodiscus trichospermus]